MEHRAVTFAAVCLMGVVGVAGVAVAGGPSVPEAGAEANFREYCRLCHRVPAEFGRQRPYEEWRDTVARMSRHLQTLKRAEIPLSAQILIARHLAGGS